MGKFISRVLLMSLIVSLLSGVSFAQDSDEQRPGKEVDKRAGFTEWDHGILFWKSDDGDFHGRFDARAFIIGAYYFENKNNLSNGFHLRKGRLALKMKLWRDWRVEWDMDMAEGVVETKDMWLSYNGFQNSYIKFGHFKVPFGLEILTTSRYIAFPERAYFALAFKMGRRLGIEYAHWGSIWNAKVTVFGQTFDVVKNKTKDETGVGAGGRFAITPIQTNDLILHTGVSGVWSRPNDETWIEDFTAEPETKVGDVEILDTGPIRNISYTYRYGVEGALLYKNFHLQGEYAKVDLFRNNDVDPDIHFDGGYVYLLWTITGESRPWDPTQGEFGQLIPDNPGLGAWELGFRFSNLSLSDTDALVLGGRANNYTGALNWYPNANMVFQLNYTKVKNSENATGEGFIGGDEFSYIQLLTKFFF